MKRHTIFEQLWLWVSGGSMNNHKHEVSVVTPQTLQVDLINEEEIRTEILLTEYKETIETLRNWDRLIYQILTVVGAVAAALITFMLEKDNPVFWGAICSLILFWVFTYLYTTRLSEARIDVLIELETRLGMVGSYRHLRKVKSAGTLTVWVVLPFFMAFGAGPLIGYIINNPARFAKMLGEWYASVVSFIAQLFH